MEATPKATDNATDNAKRSEAGNVKLAATPALATSQPIGVEDVPDPDEDDLDDLDDMLEEFSAAKLELKPVAASASDKQEHGAKATTAPPAEPQSSLDEDFSEEEFTKQLQAGMAGLLGEFEKSPEMQAQFEEMFKQMSEAAGTEKAGSSTTGAAKPSAEKSAEELSFQETIRRTMERMQSSGEQATAAAAAGNTDDFMAEMLKHLSSGDLDGGGADEDFSKMLMGMMEQLTNKEILYEPMMELHEKYPGWLAKNKNAVTAEDLKRYEEQKRVVAEIVTKFNEPTYSDSNAADREYIVNRMQKMQAAGSPPPDLVGDMASAQDAFNNAEESCNPQ